MVIKYAIADKEKNDLDELLWSVLWEPLGLARDIRKSFRIITIPVLLGDGNKQGVYQGDRAIC